MLNSETKGRINACRDILVGKVPTPQAQVEQITIALMYKFMNDMDHEALDLGGKSQFFAGEFATYSWDRITDSRLGGEERIKLYADGIEAVVKNPGVPELFRQIFRNAFLPYRDPETFLLFSKEISGFKYEHSEDLGDAFEYLLSILGSQGDAGQFRTPRHIIDFIVEVVKPQPGEAILDPACGTAGFLISAFKHIRRTHPELAPSELEDLHRNVEGYDISPDMVRLSRVNLYFHQFADPRVVEYDTLTDQSKWGTKADVILANPPFMSPKGGIRPHRKFSLESNRSEVLFVDYIAEHLMDGGRAGIIVPEGIIFQSGNAYKQLRRMLVDGYLWSVVSLPAGVFNPYSGVKTSILFLDRNIASKGLPVMFAQIKADGFDLGAQRRNIAQDDLPAALRLLNDAHHRLSTGQVPVDFRGSLEQHPTVTNLFVPRKLIEGENDCNLSGERYRQVLEVGSKKWSKVKLGEVCDINPSSAVPEQIFQEDDFYYIDISAVDSSTNRIQNLEATKCKEAPSRARRLVVKDDVLLSTVRPNLKAFALVGDLPPNRIASTGFAVLRTHNNLNPQFLLAQLLTDKLISQMEARMGKGAYPSINSSDVEGLEITLPPLSVQEEIVAEIRRYQAVINGAQQVIDNWKPSFDIDPEWPTEKLGNLCTIVRGSSPRPAGDPRYYGGTNPRLMVADLTRDGMYVTPRIDFLTDDGAKMSRYMKQGSLVMAVSGQPGNCAILRTDCYIHDGFAGFRDLDSEKVLTEYAYALLQRKEVQHNGQSTGATFQNLKTDQIKEFSIELPSLQIQKEIVAQLNREMKLVEGNRELVDVMKFRIDETISKIWK